VTGIVSGNTTFKQLHHALLLCEAPAKRADILYKNKRRTTAMTPAKAKTTYDSQYSRIAIADSA
jgi:hypothetical protein